MVSVTRTTRLDDAKPSKTTATMTFAPPERVAAADVARLHDACVTDLKRVLNDVERAALDGRPVLVRLAVTVEYDAGAQQ